MMRLHWRADANQIGDTGIFFICYFCIPPSSSVDAYKLKGKRLEISLNKLRRIPVTTWLQRFDGDFNVKSKVNLGMIAQSLGDGLS